MKNDKKKPVIAQNAGDETIGSRSLHTLGNDKRMLVLTEHGANELNKFKKKE